MWIQSTNEATRRLFNESIMDEPVVFNENNTAQVSREVGERMIEYYDTIREYKKESE